MPKMLEWSRYFGWISRIDFLSMGTLSIAEEMDQAGLSVRVLHFGVEKRINPEFSLVQYVRQHRPRFLAFAMHWHPQTYDVLEAARAIKAAVPEVFVVIGGLTASRFAADVLKQYPCIDAVVCGEAERPMRILVAGDPLQSIENLYWRNGDQVVSNPQTFVTSGQDMDAYLFGSWHLVEHARECLSQDWRYIWDDDLRESMARKIEPTLFGAALGRGCVGTCTWCAGSYGSMRETTGRKKTAWRSAERVAETFEAARNAGAKRIYTCFDPHPRKEQEILTLLEVLGSLKDKIALDFECFGLPSPRVVDAFHAHLDPSSTLIVSPECANEEVRRQHRAFPFSNAELENTLDHMTRLGMHTDLYFVLGLPGEDVDGIRATKAMQDDLRARHPLIRTMFTWPLEMEPGAPWHREPDRFGLTLRHRDLTDFHRAHGARDFALGYDTATLSEREIMYYHDQWFMGIPDETKAALAAYLEEFGDSPKFARSY